MAMWIYQANTHEGEFREGEIEADSKEDAKAKLSAGGMKPFKLSKKQESIEIVIPGVTDRIPLKSMVIFTRQMATMIDAGLPLVKCLELLGNQEPNVQLKKTILGVKGKVEGGQSFSEALGSYPKVFEELYVNLVSAGELGGILDTIMNRLAEYIEKNAETQAKVKGALKYPVTVMTIAMTITGGLLWKVVPTFADTFRSMGKTSLPAITEMLVSVSKQFTTALPYMFGGAILTVMVYRMLMKTSQGPYIRDRLLFNAPLIGNVLRKAAVARFTRTLGTLVSAGVPILDALEVVGKTSGNLVVQRALEYTRTKIQEGKNMTGPLMETQVFPTMVVQMIAVGEATGAMDIMLAKIADFYDAEVEDAVDGMSAMMEPIMMVVLGGIIGTVMLGVYMPIFTMADH
jgi:type IV pilus assembly protein PilC